MMQAARAGAQRPPRGRDAVGEGGRSKREGHNTHSWFTLLVVWPKLTQHCQTNTLQLKIKKQTNKQKTP